MRIQRIQFNNTNPSVYYCAKGRKDVTFSGGEEIKNLQIDNKNPLITDEVRSVANDLHKLFKSIEGKTLTVEGLSVGSPVDTYLYLTLIDDVSNSENVKLSLSKSSRYSEQILSAQLSITEKGKPTRQIEYCPRRQSNGIWMDDLTSRYLRETVEGIESYGYSRDRELNDIFVKYGKKFVTKFSELVKHYK